ncbi:hypothetical protein JR316_0012724 [Psilocybe cubensis]|uniref:Uncharacterized protein n=2 Tax=Psilocybe cubensis TaxID=181762 RepID=A0ACB8GJN6_PSICU|nr:hypothetical protein JR316_0012724 [Psilocybe cubensis]KAH9475607.1 hypothetical protein JR316_0012724 [Psilocybe cubensis]
MSKTLDFSSNELGRDVTLVLVFEPHNDGSLYQSLFPVAWKVLTFSAAGASQASVRYTAEGAFFVPQTAGGDNVFSIDYKRIDIGGKCVMETDDEGMNFLNPAVEGNPNSMQCEINTSQPSSVGFGTLSGTRSTVEPLMFWNKVGVSNTVSLKFTPKLKVFAEHDYHEKQIIRGKIGSTVILEQDLDDLPSSSQWVVSIDSGTGEVTIERA